MEIYRKYVILPNYVRIYKSVIKFKTVLAFSAYFTINMRKMLNLSVRSEVVIPGYKRDALTLY